MTLKPRKIKRNVTHYMHYVYLRSLPLFAERKDLWSCWPPTPPLLIAVLALLCLSGNWKTCGFYAFVHCSISFSYVILQLQRTTQQLHVAKKKNLFSWPVFQMLYQSAVILVKRLSLWNVFRGFLWFVGISFFGPLC